MDCEYYAVRWLSDYRTSLSLKGKRLFHTKKYTTILRWFVRKRYDYFIGETTTIGYDYSRSCYDYSSRNDTTITDLY